MQKFPWQQSRNLSQKAVCQNIVETIGKVFSVDLAILLVVDPLTNQKQYFKASKLVEPAQKDEYEFFKEIALVADRVIVVDDLEKDFHHQDNESLSYLVSYQNQIKSILAVPLTCQYELKAYLNLFTFQEARIWKSEDVGLAMMMATQGGLAISQTYAYDEIKVWAQNEITISRITAIIRSSLEPQAIYNAIVTELGTTLKVEGCALSLWTKHDRYMRCVAFHNPNMIKTVPKETKDWQRSTISLVPIAENPLLQRLLHDPNPVSLCDLKQDPDSARFDLPWRSHSRSLLIVPLIFDGEIIGSITLREGNKARYWRDSEIELAKAVASHAAIAVTQSKLYETTRRQAKQLAASENRVKELNNYLTESILKRFLPEAIANKAATGSLALDLRPEPHLVTVLFCDLVGFTNLSRKLEVKMLSELLNEYLQAMTQAVFENSGTIDKFVGDGVMALFGAPESLSPDKQAQKAIATARDMYRYLIPLNQKWSAHPDWQSREIPDLQLRCGIHQGRAVVGMFGGKHRKDYTAIGNVVNIAARLQQNAQPDCILISEAIYSNLPPNEAVGVESNCIKLKGIESNFCSYSLCIQKNLSNK